MISEKYPASSPENHSNHSGSEQITEGRHEYQVSAENLKSSQEKRHESLKIARHEAEIQAKNTEQIAQELANRHEPQQTEPRIGLSREIKEMAYHRSLTRARQHLSAPARLMSRIIHQPAVDAISEAVGKTVGRSSGILGGGLFALLGTTCYYLLARHYGYNYNAFVFLALLACGFVLGWTLEAFYKIFKIFRKS